MGYHIFTGDVGVRFLLLLETCFLFISLDGAICQLHRLYYIERKKRKFSLVLDQKCRYFRLVSNPGICLKKFI